MKHRDQENHNQRPKSQGPKSQDSKRKELGSQNHPHQSQYRGDQPGYAKSTLSSQAKQPTQPWQSHQNNAARPGFSAFDPNQAQRRSLGGEQEQRRQGHQPPHNTPNSSRRQTPDTPRGNRGRPGS